MRSALLFFGAAGAFVGVALGAFGAHGLKGVISPNLMAVYQTAVTYQMWHALGLCVLALLQRQAPDSLLLQWSGWLMLSGIVLFSGSLYLLAVLDLKWLGMITPLGGLSLLTAWALLALYAIRN